jgi:hypothetical protein
MPERDQGREVGREYLYIVILPYVAEAISAIEVVFKVLGAANDL